MNARRFLPELEGIRGYAFIVVFFVHYLGGLVTEPTGKDIWHYGWFLFIQISWVAVPIFFVLSGYLITGILYDTRNRESFFKVFYGRRALRILPLYYLVLFLAAAFVIATHQRLGRQHALYLIYLQNFCRDPGIAHFGNNIEFGHLWSLAVEEQFYLVWPVVIWFLQDRRSLLRFCYGSIGAVCILRVVWPDLHLGNSFAYYFTLTRCDAILLGCALSLHERGNGFDIQRLVAPSRIFTILGIAVFYAKVLYSGQGSAFNATGIALLYPLINLISLGIVILCLAPGTVVHRLCRVRWACSLGSLSYGLYIIHYVPVLYVLRHVLPQLTGESGRFGAHFIILLAIGILTYSIAALAYRYIEMPALQLKTRLKYGPERLAVPSSASMGELTSLETSYGHSAKE